METRILTGGVLSDPQTILRNIMTNVETFVGGVVTPEMRSSHDPILVRLEGQTHHAIFEDLHVRDMKPTLLLWLEQSSGIWHVTITPVSHGSGWAEWQLGNRVAVLPYGQQALPSEIWSAVGY
jgi:hypothetical protein